jgi:hypothetical protein
MIEKINYARLTNNELYTLIKTIISILTGVDQEALGLKKWIDKLLIPFNTLELSIGKEKGSELTPVIQQDDDLRDRCFKALKTYIEACLLRNNQEWANAAEVLWRIFNNHDLYLHARSYSKESALLDNLILELNDNMEVQTALDVINAREWFNELNESENIFKAHWNERREQSANKPASDSQEARKQIRITSQNLFQFIELMNISNEDDTYLSLINNINEEVIKSNTIVKARITRRKNNEEVMEESEV